jgi:hypothetical protein
MRLVGVFVGALVALSLLAPAAKAVVHRFFNGPAAGAYDIGTKPRSRAAYRHFIVPLTQ